MDDTRYAEMRGQLDAAQVVIGLLLQQSAVDLQGNNPLKAEILRYAQGLREQAKGNPLTVAQANALELYAAQVPER